MSAITYPISTDQDRAQAAPSTDGRRRRLAMWLPRRWDDRTNVERNASLSEVTLRSVSETPSMYR